MQRWSTVQWRRKPRRAFVAPARVKEAAVASLRREPRVGELVKVLLLVRVDGARDLGGLRESC